MATGPAGDARRHLHVAWYWMPPGKNTIASVATGCLGVFSGPYPDPSWRIAFLHSLFENSAAVAVGVEVAYRALKKAPVNVLAMGGDEVAKALLLQAYSIISNF